MNVCDYLLEGKPKSATALITLDGRYSFEDVEEASRRIADVLVRSGSAKGDRAILLAKSGMFWVGAYLGTMRAGLVCVPLPPKIASDDLAYVVDTTEPTFAFVESQAAEELKPCLGKARLITDAHVGLSEGRSGESQHRSR